MQVLKQWHARLKGKDLLTNNKKLFCPNTHFTVVCLDAWPLNESEAAVDLVLIETSLLFFCKVPLISMKTASLA